MDKKTVLVTGGAKRIGAAISTVLAKAGWHVLIHADQSVKEAEILCRSLTAEGYAAVPVAPFPFFTSQDVEKCFSAALCAAHGKIDALVNNAAVFFRIPLMVSNAEDFDNAWRVNALTPIHLTMLLAFHLAGRNAQGAVVNLLDQRVAHPSTGDIPYTLSKKALEAFTLSAARELAPMIRVNAVAPGAALAPPGANAHERAGSFPLGRKPTADEIAASVRFLLESSWVTGQILFADCGQHLV